MGDIFDYYPLSSRITFFPAGIDEIRQVFDQFPVQWQSLPGMPRFPRTEGHPVFHQVLERPTAPQEWQDILLPQNYDTRFLFVDVDLDGWTAVISAHDDFSVQRSWISHGLLVTILERDGYRGVGDLPEFSSISLSYDFEPVMRTSPVRRRTASLAVEVASTRTQFTWSKNTTYDRNVPWFVYDCWARGRQPYQGLDLPVVEDLSASHDESLPGYLQLQPRDGLAFGFRPQRFFEQWDEEMERDYRSVLPFDSTGHERVAEFFNTTIVAQWLRDNHGIRWEDPSFYEGDSLLYVVGDPGGIDDPFTPRIPVETYHRFQGIDLERNQDLIDRGRF